MSPRSRHIAERAKAPDSLRSDDEDEGTITFRLNRRQLENALEAQEPSEVDLRDGDILLVVPALPEQAETTDSGEPPPS